MSTDYRELHNNHIKKTKEAIEIEMYQLCRENTELLAELRRAEDAKKTIK